MANSGTAATRQRIVVAGGGYLVGRWSRTGRLAADFPSFNGSAGGPRAVVAVSNAGSRDGLDPGAARFTFGADVRHDAVGAGTGFDNGNNVIQRGLSTHAAQYKIQIDGGYATCRVKGNRGLLSVESRRFMASATWYRVVCMRQVWARGSYLQLSVTPVRRDGTLGEPCPVRRPSRPPGPPASGRTALALGGKLGPGPSIDAASDQFNGWIDNAFFRVL